MDKVKISQGTAHKVPNDLRSALTDDSAAYAAWQDITPLARNEFICWVMSAKLIDTRSRRVRRTIEELLEGRRRPCCWAGCMHRLAKPTI